MKTPIHDNTQKQPRGRGSDHVHYRTDLLKWRAAEGQFESWLLEGTALASDGSLVLDRSGMRRGTDPYPPGGYHGHNFYNGGRYLFGEATSPAMPTPFPFTEAIASWNALTPEGTWIEVLLRVEAGDLWTEWYSMGVWASDISTVERHSVDGQLDPDVHVDTDTLVVGSRDRPLTASAFQLCLRLFTTGRGRTPVVRNTAVVISNTPSAPDVPIPGDPALWDRVLDVPACSQMVYPDGGNVWCSPTALCMVLRYRGVVDGPCEPCIRSAVSGVYDWLYGGHGNWPFNTAYAHALSGGQLEAYVTRLASMAEAEQWIARGVPLIISYGWREGQLTGAPIPRSSGHLAVLVGFDASGNPVVNDPAAPDDASVRRTYLRYELEPLWLRHSGGTVYLIRG